MSPQKIKNHIFRQLTTRGRLIRQILLGPAYWYHTWLIKKSKLWSIEQQLKHTELKTRRIVAQYSKNIIRSKAHYTESKGKYNRLCFPIVTKLMRTGGTTGSPFFFYMDTFWRRQKERAYLFDIWSITDYKPFDLRVVFRGNIGNKFISYNWLENAIIISPNQLTDDTHKNLTSFLQTLPPFHLHVYPSSLFSLIGRLGESAFRALPIIGVLAGSEVFPRQQINIFERKFNIPIAHWYGHSEYATLAYSCRHCEGFHFYPTYGYTELLPINDQLSQIIVTSYNLFGTQFVRYDTADLAKRSTKQCYKPFLRVDAIIGREQDYFFGKDRTRHAFGPYLFGIHNIFWEKIKDIQFQQNEYGLLNVKIVFTKPSDTVWLEGYLRSRFAICELQFEYVQVITKTDTGKHRYFISRLT